MLPILLFSAASCDRAFYDFGDATDSGNGGNVDCESVVPVGHSCSLSPPDGGCYTQSTVTTFSLEEGLGCAPAGQAFGVVELPVYGTSEEVDLYAWAYKPQMSVPSPYDNVSLSVFADECGVTPLGSLPQCDYRSHLFLSGVDKRGSLFLHTQTSAEAVVEVGYQIVEHDDWSPSLPEVSADISCALLNNGVVDISFIQTPPWSGSTVPLDFLLVPPASEKNLRICGQAAEGWRQAAFLLRNLTEAKPRVLGINLALGDTGMGLVDFHYALFRCTDGEKVKAGALSLVESCYDSGNHPSKSMDFTFPIWNDEDPSTEFLLILQVPPTAGHNLDFRFEVEGHGGPS